MAALFAADGISLRGGIARRGGEVDGSDVREEEVARCEVAPDDVVGDVEFGRDEVAGGRLAAGSWRGISVEVFTLMFPSSSISASKLVSCESGMGVAATTDDGDGVFR